MSTNRSVYTPSVAKGTPAVSFWTQRDCGAGGTPDRVARRSPAPTSVPVWRTFFPAVFLLSFSSRSVPVAYDRIESLGDWLAKQLDKVKISKLKQPRPFGHCLGLVSAELVILKAEPLLWPGGSS
jgi:hypothetical protein